MKYRIHIINLCIYFILIYIIIYLERDSLM